MITKRAQRIARIIIWAVPLLLFMWIIDRNLVLFGTTTLRCVADSCDSRIKNLISHERETTIGTAKGTKERYRIFSGNPLSFDVQLFRPITHATVRLVYKGGSIGNRISLAVSTRSGKDENVEFADSTALTASLESSWDVIRSDDVVLFQKPGSKLPRYTSIDDFFVNLPIGKKIGQYNVDAASWVPIPLYVPAVTPTTIKLNVRGSHTFTTYVGGNEDLDVTFSLQNSNRNVGKDDVTFRVYHGIELVEKKVLKDSGSGKGDGKPSLAREVTINVPRPALGTYRIEVSTTDDQFIRTITTHQRYLMWSGKIYLAGSSEYKVLGQVEDEPLTLYVKGTTLSANTAHVSGLQIIVAGSKKLAVTKSHAQFTLKLPASDDFIPVTVPVRDVNLTTDGVFVLSKDSAFTVPAKGITTLTGGSDPSLLDYVIAKYVPAERAGEWIVAEKTIEADLGRSTRFTFSFDPPLSAGAEALRMKELTVKVVGGPITFNDIKKGLSKIFNGAK